MGCVCSPSNIFLISLNLVSTMDKKYVTIGATCAALGMSYMIIRNSYKLPSTNSLKPDDASWLDDDAFRTLSAMCDALIPHYTSAEVDADGVKKAAGSMS